MQENKTSCFCHMCFRNGDITALRVDAIVNPSNETLDDKNPVSNHIHRAAGPELLAYCKKEIRGIFNNGS